MDGIFEVKFLVYGGLGRTLLRVAKIYSVDDYISEEHIKSFSQILIDSLSEETGLLKELITVEVIKE